MIEATLKFSNNFRYKPGKQLYAAITGDGEKWTVKIESQNDSAILDSSKVNVSFLIKDAEKYLKNNTEVYYGNILVGTLYV